MSGTYKNNLPHMSLVGGHIPASVGGSTEMFLFLAEERLKTLRRLQLNPSPPSSNISHNSQIKTLSKTQPSHNIRQPGLANQTTSAD